MKSLSCKEFVAHESPKDTEYFGIASAKVLLNQPCIAIQTQRELIRFMQDFEFITIVNDANDPINNHWLGERTNAFLTDMNMQLNKQVLPDLKYNDVSTTIVDNYPGDRHIIQIAETSFKVSRFLNDPNLPFEKARCIYADITKNAFGKEGRFFIIFKSQDVVSGFIMFSINKLDSSALIELIAIDQNYQRNGIGSSLIRSLEHYASNNGVKSINVGTQFNNIDALNFYARNRYVFIKLNSIFHYWPHKPKQRLF